MIKVESPAIEKVRKELEGITDGLETVVVNAINVVSVEARKEAIKEITDKFYIDADPLRKGIHIRKAHPTKHSFAVIQNNRKRDRFTLARFKVVEPSKGPIKVAQSRSGGLKELKRGFIQNGQVWRRRGKAAYPFDIQRGYSIGGMLESENIFEDLEETAMERLETQLDKEVDKFFDKKGE